MLEELDNQKGFAKLLTIMNQLRAHCPWDKKQTIESLRHLTLEETYELSDAIINKDWDELKKELGDLLLHIVFYSKIASEKAKFDIFDVIEQLCEKLIFRHPHIYSDLEVEDVNQVKENWEKLKLKEGEKSVFQGVPSSMPALIKAIRIQEKASGVGFDWENSSDVKAKVEEELKEFLEAKESCDKVQMEQEFGDLMFSLINYSRFLQINPEDALEKTNRKFIKRFQYIEDKARESNHSIVDLTLEQMEAYWQKAKEELY